MSRLDSFIRRLEAQRACLELAVAEVRGLPGPVLEFGLGNGRTYDHLRELMPTREIFVFDRQVAAHPDCIPAPGHLILGEIRETVTAAARRWPGVVALVHSDVGTGDAAANAELAAWLAAALPPLLAEGAWVVADQALRTSVLVPRPPPAGVAAKRYFLYRHQPA